MGVAPPLNKLETKSFKDAVCQVLIKLGRGSGDVGFQISSKYFRYLEMTPLLERVWSFI